MERFDISMKGVQHRVLPELVLAMQEKVLEGWRFDAELMKDRAYAPRMSNGRYNIPMVKGSGVAGSITVEDTLDSLTTHKELKLWAESNDIDVPKNLKNPTALRNYLKEQLKAPTLVESIVSALKSNKQEVTADE